MLGQFYGECDFDGANPEPSSLEGSSDCELRESKANLIRSLMSRESLPVACLVEEDARGLAGATVSDVSSSPTCFLKLGRRGMA